MNIDLTSTLFTLVVKYELTQPQCQEGASDANVSWRTPII